MNDITAAPACQYCAKGRRHMLYLATCEGCKARSLANSPQFFTAAQSNAITPSYRDALQRVFGDKWREGHELVKEVANAG